MEITKLSGRTNHVLVVCLLGIVFVGMAGGNVKDASGNIRWDELPSEPKYNTSTAEPEFTYEVVFVVASEFIHAVAPYEFPWDLLRGIINGTIDPLRDYTMFVSYSAGFIACFSVGLLFIVVMPITGIIFCCCRCCENCGGKMLQRDKYNTTCRRVSFALLLTLITACMALGLVGTFMANSQMSASIDDVGGTVETNIEDISSYVRHTFQEFNFLAFHQFSYVSRLILTDLLNVDGLVGEPVRDVIEEKVDPALSSVYKLGRDSKGLQENLVAVNQSVNELTQKAADLQTALDQVRNDINATLQSIPCTDQSCPKNEVDLETLTTAADFSVINIESELNLVNEALKTNITDLALKGEEQVDGIPDKVKNESEAVVDEFMKELDKLKENIQQEINTIEFQLSPEILNFLDMISKDSEDSFTKQLYDILDWVQLFDKYRFWVGIALCCIILIIILCNFLGMLFGECGRDKRDRPTERGCLSNFGGTVLLAGVAFSFIFSAIIMILTTICFLLGGVSEKVVCEPIASRAIFKEVIDYPYLIDKRYRYWLSDNLFGTGSKPLTVQSLINSCQVDEALYRALRLENVYNITAALDYRELYPDIETHLDIINIDLSSVEILDPSTKTALNDFIDSGVADVNYTQYLQEIRKGITQVNLEELAARLEGYAQDLPPSSAQGNLTQQAATLRAIQTDQVDPMEGFVNSLEANLDALLSQAEDLSPLVNQSLERVQETQDFIQIDGPTIFREQLESFVDVILNYVDQYALYVLTKVNNEVGGCKPVANLYDSVENLVCKNLVYSFNGFWLCLGWCVIFFIPSIIFAVKLSKFYRRMRFYEDYYNAKDSVTGERHFDVVRLTSMSRHGNSSDEDLRIAAASKEPYENSTTHLYGPVEEDNRKNDMSSAFNGTQSGLPPSW